METDRMDGDRKFMQILNHAITVNNGAMKLDAS